MHEIRGWVLSAAIESFHVVLCVAIMRCVLVTPAGLTSWLFGQLFPGQPSLIAAQPGLSSHYNINERKQKPTLGILNLLKLFCVI